MDRPHGFDLQQVRFFREIERRVQRLVYDSITRHIPKEIELPVHADELSLREIMKINSRPGGDGVHIPDFWNKLDKVLGA